MTSSLFLCLALLLLLTALVLKLRFTSYDYIAFFLVLAALRLLLPLFCPPLLVTIYSVPVGLLVLLILVLEVFIVKDAFTEDVPQIDAIILLGAAVRGNVPSQAMLHRCDGALEFLRNHPRVVAVLTGGQGVNEDITEAEAMFRYLTERGISPDRLLLEEKAGSTTENLRFSFSLLRENGLEPDGHCAIVSSPYHLHRAKKMAKSMGVSAYGVAGRLGLPVAGLNYFIREAFGLMYLAVFHR